MGGAASKQKCGTILRPPVAVMGLSDLETVKTHRGALISERRASIPGVSRVREKTSNGPAKSRSSTMSKIRIPTFTFRIAYCPRMRTASRAYIRAESQSLLIAINSNRTIATGQIIGPIAQSRMRNVWVRCNFTRRWCSTRSTMRHAVHSPALRGSRFGVLLAVRP